MALSYVFGTVGSGKTYDMLCRMTDDMAAGHEVVTINCRLKIPLVKKYLIDRMDVSPYNADVVCGLHRTITTEDEFRRLKGRDGRQVKLYADEAHFWWPSNAHYKLNINDVYSVAMSRKQHVDVHMVSQRYGQVHRDIAGYCHEVWKAMPFTLKPIPQVLALQVKFARLFGLEERPKAFLYMKKTGDVGNETLDIDKAAITNKRVRYLRPQLAALYDTEEVVSSPVLDRIKRESELDYLRDVLFNRVRPSSPCPDCDGTRRCTVGLVYNPVIGLSERVVCTRGVMTSPWFIRTVGEESCGRCEVAGSPRGYVYPDDHPDFAEAEKVRGYFTNDGKRKSSRVDQA